MAIKDDFYNIKLNPDSINYGDNFSIKTNFLILFKRLKDIFSITKTIVDYIKFLDSNNDRNNIISEIYDNISKTKIVFKIDNSVAVGNKTNINILNKLYYIEKKDTNKFIITREESEWNTDKLFVQCKIGENTVNNDKLGTIVYPLIQTVNNQINIEFTDPEFNNNIDVIIF